MITPNPHFTPAQRLQLTIFSIAGWLLVRCIGPTLRYRVENWQRVLDLKRTDGPLILSFWHNQIVPGLYFWKGRDIVVITSRNFDGEYIARIIRRFGYGTARGSSSRGAVKALLELKQHLEAGRDVAFSIDGPRGPVYRVKPGPLWLSRRTGRPILPFHVEPKRFWMLRSWDHFRIPKPFSPVLIKIGRPLYVPQDGEEKHWLARYQHEMDRLRRYCEEYWKENGK